MCGIGGIFLKNHQALELDQLLSNMKDHLRNRGPDAEGDFITEDKRVGLCHTRLSIIDISDQSNQPFVSSDEPFMRGVISLGIKLGSICPSESILIIISGSNFKA